MDCEEIIKAMAHYHSWHHLSTSTVSALLSHRLRPSAVSMCHSFRPPHLFRLCYRAETSATTVLRSSPLSLSLSKKKGYKPISLADLASIRAPAMLKAQLIFTCGPGVCSF